MAFIDPRLARAETARLHLRMPRESDFEAWARWMGDQRLTTFLLGVQSREDAFRNLAMMIGHWHLRGFGMWTMVDKASGSPVGRGGLWQPEGWPGLEIGWLVAPEAQGLGYATEMAQAAASLAFEVLHVDSVISLIHPDNAKSIAVAKRIQAQRAESALMRGINVDVYRLPRTKHVSATNRQSS
jgi:RimJ/RimL family protein N-acetyltransferase